MIDARSQGAGLSAWRCAASSGDSLFRMIQPEEAGTAPASPARRSLTAPAALLAALALTRCGGAPPSLPVIDVARRAGKAPPADDLRGGAALPAR